MVPKSPSYTAIVAVAAILGVLLVIGQVVNRPTGFSIGWALWLVLGFTLLQSVAAVAAMLFESGALRAAAAAAVPAYGQYGPPQAGYYASRRLRRGTRPAVRVSGWLSGELPQAGRRADTPNRATTLRTLRRVGSRHTPRHRRPGPSRLRIRPPSRRSPHPARPRPERSVRS